MNHCIVEKLAGMPDWVEIGIQVMVRDYATDKWEGPYVLVGFDSTQGYPFLTIKGSCWIEAKPYIPWTPKEGEWVRAWDSADSPKGVHIGRYSGVHEGRLLIDGFSWNYCARITNDDGSLIDIRCTVDELKAKTDWLGPEEA